MYCKVKEFFIDELGRVRDSGLFKDERIITSPQSSRITIADGRQVLNMCANNYLGLSNHPEVVAAAQAAAGDWGFGLSSVRFICGTQALHKQLEAAISDFLGMEDAILYSSCFDANGGLFEVLLKEEDAIISDALNHASIIDGIRLCKAKRFRYRHSDIQDLEDKLKDAQSCRFRMIATDGVFSMDGDVAKLDAVCDLAEGYDALVMVDDSHATGFLGPKGRGSHEYCGVMERIDVMTGTLGKALGGASGGYTSARRQVVAWLRQRSRPYLFSNSLAPMITVASMRVLEMIEESSGLRRKLSENSAYFRKGMGALGFDLVPGDHPIIPVMLGDAVLATRMASRMLEKGIYVVGFSFPVVPRGKARIRTQMSAAHNRGHLDRAITAFAEVGRELDIIKGDKL